MSRIQARHAPVAISGPARPGMNGSGDAMFRELLANPAVAALPAVADHEVLLLEGRQVQALGLASTVEGRELIAQWLAVD